MLEVRAYRTSMTVERSDLTVDVSSLDLPEGVTREQVVRMFKNRHFFRSVVACWAIYDAKGEDYTRGLGDLDRSDNFKKAAENNGITPYQAWGVYFYKHVSAVWRFLKDGKLASEPIEQRLYDVINYAILLLLLIETEAEQKGPGL